MKMTFFSTILLLATAFSFAQINQLQVDLSKSRAKIYPTMYGIFYEDINFAGDGGLYAEMIKNRGFEFEEPMMGWTQPNSDRFSLNTNSGIATIMKTGDNPANRNFCRILVKDDKGYELINEGFRGMGVKKDTRYRLSLQASKQSGDIKKIIFQLVTADKKVLAEIAIIPQGTDWNTYSGALIAADTEAKAHLKISFQGTGSIDLDMISLFPEDTWKGRKNGLRRDIVQLLYDLQPGFLRFPGGCIVEGRTLAKRYQWKKTVGPVEDRTVMINRWNTEFKHRPAPDYFQSFGLGFFEYFQLAEDLGAEPLPILSCGMACQFNTGELVPLDEIDPYVQDALDLIEFANGPISSPWGKVRSNMGHPQPFNMKYIGIGNEQWGPEYIKRYKVFANAIKQKYPDIFLVSGSGPFPDGDFFEYGWQELKKLGAEIVDEHYYRAPEWFRENVTRYDNYDRSGPKIFAGEYAAQSVGIASPDNKNNWECALSEAAFMTGLERNADIVVMSSYAPLLAHVDGWQWTPDLIWFDNLRSYGTANYYVQKMYARHHGTDLLSVSYTDGSIAAGQKQLYASAVKDSKSGELIIKLVNTSDKAQTVSIDIMNQKVDNKATILTLTSESLSDVNSFENPQKISPRESQTDIVQNQLKIEIGAQTFQVIKTGLQ
jgi:alpha-L-arabinofuranosidase